MPLLERDAEAADPHDTLGDRLTALEVEAALAALPYDQRAAILLVDVHGMPVDDVAAVLGVPSGTVKSRCSRGRARLALSLGHLRNRPDAPPVPPVPGPPTSRTDRAGRDQAGPDQAGPDQAGPDQAGPDQAGPDQEGGAA